MGKLEGKVAIVTGGGTGIGKAIARAYAREGASLVLASRTRANLERSAGLLRDEGATVEVLPTDVTDESQVVALFEFVMNRLGRLDILVNNSATGAYVPLWEMDVAEWRTIIDVNLNGAFICTREAMKIMRTRGGGRIINIGAISAKKPRFDQAAFSASKAALVSLTVSTALEGRADGIAASCLHPGLVDVTTELEDPSTGTTLDEPAADTDSIAATALTMAVLPPTVNMLEALVMPTEQLFLGRG